MLESRKISFFLENTPYYYCVSDYGKNVISGRDEALAVEHDRSWIEQRLLFLAQVFAIDVATYAIMNNQIHTVLRINLPLHDRWSPLEVITRWHLLFKGNSLSKRVLAGNTLKPAEQAALHIVIAIWRARLINIHWFMRCLTRPAALQTHKREWTNRSKHFICQAIPNENRLAASMVYVDLLPIRTGIASSPDTSDYTSLKRRMISLQKAMYGQTPPQDRTLLEFAGNPRHNMPDGLPFQLIDYVELIEWAYCHSPSGSTHSVNQHYPSILQRLHIPIENWLESTFESHPDFKYLFDLKAIWFKLKKALNLKRQVSDRVLHVN